MPHSRNGCLKDGTGYSRGLRIGIVCLCCLAFFVLVRFWTGAETANAESDRRSSNTSNRGQTTASQTMKRDTKPPGSATHDIVAVVNGEPISRSHLTKECLRRHGKEMLESVINKHLIRQECQRRGVKITEQDVANEIARLAKSFGLSAGQLISTLRKERNMTAKQYRDEIWAWLALRRLASKRLQVSQTELKQALESEFGPKVQVRMISVSSPAKAREILRAAKADPDGFESLAREESEDVNSAAARGLIPPIGKHMGDKKIEQAVFALKEGEISDIVRAARQYLVFKCERHLDPVNIPPQSRPDIEKRLAEEIRESKLRSVSGQLFKQLQADAKVVNVLNNPELSKKMKGVAASINGQRISLRYLADVCIARHGEKVLEGEINRKLLFQSLRKQNLKVTETDIDREIDRAASSFGYQDRQSWLEYVTDEEHITVDLYVRDSVWPSVALKKLVQSNVRVTKEDIEKGFAANYGPRVRVLAIVLSNRHTANKAWKMARDNPSVDYFGQLASQYSIEPISKANFGEVPPIARHSGQPLVENEAFRLMEMAKSPKPMRKSENAALSGILSVADKYVILRYLGTTDPVVNDLSDVRDELVRHLHEEKLRVAMAKRFDEIKDRGQVDNILAGKVHSGSGSAREVLTRLEKNTTSGKNSPGQSTQYARRNSSGRRVR